MEIRGDSAAVQCPLLWLIAILFFSFQTANTIGSPFVHIHEKYKYKTAVTSYSIRREKQNILKTQYTQEVQTAFTVVYSLLYNL